MIDESGVRTGQELHLAWETLQNEAQSLRDYLALDLDLPLAVLTVGLGEESEDGSTGKGVMVQMET